MNAIASRHGQKVAAQPLALYDLTLDPAETHDLASEHPDIVERLSALAVPVRSALGDKLTGAPGTERRPAGFVPAK
jgi:arylsulfatase